MSRLCPRGFEYLFFGLFAMTNRASSVIGPNVIQKIIDDAHGNFRWVFFVIVGMLIIWFGVDLQKGRRDAEAFHLVHAPDRPHNALRGATNSGRHESYELQTE